MTVYRCGCRQYDQCDECDLGVDARSEPRGWATPQRQEGGLTPCPSCHASYWSPLGACPNCPVTA